jgi:hypothetical protein
MYKYPVGPLFVCLVWIILVAWFFAATSSGISSVAVLQLVSITRQASLIGTAGQLLVALNMCIGRHDVCITEATCCVTA